MSSTISSTPLRSHSADSPRSQSSLATLTPPSAWIVSRITAAGRSASGRSRYAASAASESSPPDGPPSNGSATVCSSGTPAPARFDGFDVTASDPSVMPWKPSRNATTVGRPVTLRASLSAASTAFVPVGPGNCTL